MVHVFLRICRLIFFLLLPLFFFTFVGPRALYYNYNRLASVILTFEKRVEDNVYPSLPPCQEVWEWDILADGDSCHFHKVRNPHFHLLFNLIYMVNERFQAKDNFMNDRTIRFYTF